MAFAPALAGFFTAAGTVYNVSAQMKAAKQQESAAAESEKIGRQNAAVIESETREEIRRGKLEDAQKLGSARALSQASGITGEGTVNTFLKDLDSSQKESLSWLATSGENRARIAELTGQYTASQGRANATSTRASAVGNFTSGASSVYNMGSDQGWWN